MYVEGVFVWHEACIPMRWEEKLLIYLVWGHQWLSFLFVTGSKKVFIWHYVRQKTNAYSAKTIQTKR
jgi:hypothetical protein